MRRLAVALALLATAAGCNAIVGIKSVEEDPGNNEPDAAINTCKVNSTYELLQAVDGVRNASALLFPNLSISFAMALNVDKESDLFGVLLQPGKGSMPDPLAPGSYTIGAADSKLETCGICAFIAVDYAGMLTGDNMYLATSGTLELQTISGRLQATLSNVHLRHVIVGATTEEAADLCATDIQSVNINMTYVPADAGPPDAPPPEPDAPPPEPDAAEPPPDAGPEIDAGPTVTVTGTVIDTYVGADGQTFADSKINLVGTRIEGHTLVGDTFVSSTGTGNADGTFSIPGLPQGQPHYIRVGQTYLVTSSLTTDFGSNVLGRVDQVKVPRETALFSVNLSGLIAAKDTDVFEFFAPGINLLFTQDADDGQTLLQGSFWTTALIDGGKGDLLTVTQLSTENSGTAQEYQSLGRYKVMPSFTMSQGTTQNIPATGFEITPKTNSVILDYRATTFGNARADVAPTAELEDHSLYLAVVTGRPRNTYMFTAPDLFIGRRTSNVNYNFGSVMYADPFPKLASWERWAFARSGFHVAYTAPGALTSTEVGAQITRTDLLSTISGKLITAVVTPLRNPRINEQDAFVARTGVGLTPKVSWTAPATGAPTGYRVIIDELAADGDQASTFSFVASIYTRDLSVRIPPGVLIAGKTYFLYMTALTIPNGNLDRAPFRRGLPEATADTLTAKFAP